MITEEARRELRRAATEAESAAIRIMPQESAPGLSKKERAKITTIVHNLLNAVRSARYLADDL